MNVKPDIVTAAVLVIGDEILSGRTKDKNIGYIADYLTAIGIDLKEVRIVCDDAAAIVEAVNALRSKYTYVFTTGGIGPTHDDITADCVAKAFGVPIDVDPRALAILHEWLKATGVSTRWRPSSRPAFACFRKPCARMRARATAARSSMRSPRPTPKS